MKIYKWFILSLGALFFASCEKELEQELTDVSVSVAANENVKYEGNIVTVRKGTPIQFLLHGDPDYVSFFSGEIGHQYIYHDRKEISVDEIESCRLKFSVWAEFGVAASFKDQLDILYRVEEEESPILGKSLMSKTDFEADSVLVEQNTPWEAWVSRSELPTALGVGNARTFDKSVKEYIGKKMSLAIVLNKDKKEAGLSTDGETTIAQSSFNFLDMRIETKLRNGRVITSYADAFGLTPLNMKNKTVFKDQTLADMPSDREYGSAMSKVTGMCYLVGVGTGAFTMAGTAAEAKWKYSWLVSDYLNLAECGEPDLGVKVKDVTQGLDTHAHTYSQVGTYTATFLMNNANYSHSASKTCELVINVTE